MFIYNKPNKWRNKKDKDMFIYKSQISGGIKTSANCNTIGSLSKYVTNSVAVQQGKSG